MHLEFAVLLVILFNVSVVERFYSEAHCNTIKDVAIKIKAAVGSIAFFE